MSLDNRSRSPSPTPGDYPSPASTDNHGRDHVSRRTTLPSRPNDDAGERSDGDASPADPAYTRPVPSDSSTQDAPSIRWADESVIGWHRDVEHTCAATIDGQLSDKAIAYLKEHQDDAVGGAPPLYRVVPPEPRFEAYLNTVNGTDPDPVIVTVEPEPEPNKTGVVTVTGSGFERRIPQGKETQKELARRRVQEWQEPWI